MAEPNATDEQKENESTTDHELTPSIQIVSDIHLEFTGVFDKMQKEDRFPTGGAPILCLLGDIGYPHEKHYWRFIDEILDRFKYIIIITGNHEYYKSEYHVVHETIREKLASTPSYKNKVYFLHNQVLELDDVLPDTRILGTTLWVNYVNAEQDFNIAIQYEYQVNDFRRIKYKPLPDQEQKEEEEEDNDDEQEELVEDSQGGTKKKIPLLTSVNVNRLHKESVEFLERELKRAKEDNKKCIVLTHHAPTNYQTIYPETNYADAPVLYGMNYASMEYLFKKPLVAWCFGHTHQNVDYFVKSTDEEDQAWIARIAANQQGYIVGPSGNKAPKDYSNQKVLRFPNEHAENEQVPVIGFEELQKHLVDKATLVPDPSVISGKSEQQKLEEEDLKHCKEGCVIL